MNIKNTSTSSLGGTSRIKTLSVLLVALSLARSAIAQTEERLIIYDTAPSVLGVPGIITVTVAYTAPDKIIVGEFEKSASIGRLLQDLTQAWYDLAKQRGDTQDEAIVNVYLKLDKKLLDMEAETKAKRIITKTF